MKHLTPEMAWAIGLFEGEGTIFLQRREGRAPGRYIAVAMTDEDTIRRFAEIVGCGLLRFQPRQGNRKTLYKWRTGRWEDIERLLTLWRPYLSERRQAQADEVLSVPARWSRAPGSTGRKSSKHCM